jgi:hypothetical protein
MHETLSYLALSMGLAWASGINLYAAVLMLGLLGATGNMPLPEALQVLQQPLVIGVAGLMYGIEFFADKIPGVDSAWDALHTFIRIPAGAVLAASAIADVDPTYTLAAALIGGGLTAGTHLTKASTRLMINTLPEPFSNIGVSLAEDGMAVAGLWVALYSPLVFLIFLGLFLLLMIWLLPILWRGFMGIIDTLRGFFRVDEPGQLPRP